MKAFTEDPKPDKGLSNQDKISLPEPENTAGNHDAEATEFLDEDLRMTEQPFERPE